MGAKKSIYEAVMHSPLEQEFFVRDTLTVARQLLGKHLYVRVEDVADYTVLKIVETEAYTQDDPSCHAFRGAKGRAATLFKQPGLAYVYFIYGMYHCLNVVTEPEGRGAAVLFRALEPVYNPQGLDLKTHGPGRLCKALNITRAMHNEVWMTRPDSPIYLAEGEPVDDADVVTTTRIGISSAQDYPWRFYLRGNPWVSIKAG